MAALYDPIQASFENAARDFKASLNDQQLVNEILEVKTVNDLYDFTDLLQKEQAKSGHLRRLNRIQPFLETLRSYAEVIEVFMQAKQDVLSLIWGPIKLLLQWADSMKKSFDAIVDSLAEINLLLPEFQTARALFDTNELIKDVLVLFFRDILDIYLIALKFFRKSGWKSIFDSMWTKQQSKINLVKTQVERHTRLLRREVSLEHIQEAHNTYLQAREHYDKTEKSVLRQEYRAIKADVSPQPFEKKLDYLHARTCQGTGQWLRSDTTFAKWLDKAEMSTRILWLHGIPGAGKTFLASTIVYETKRVQETRTVYAFLSDSQRSTISALSILHSFIFQLSAGQDDLEEVLCSSNHEELKSSVDVATDLLQKLLGCAGRPTYIVLDGLDEIDQRERCRLLNQLLSVSQACLEARVIISSRAEADIEDLLKGVPSIRVDNHNAGSIQKFVTQHTQEWFSKCDFLPEAQSEIQVLLAPLAAKAKGMFLYADIVLSSMDSMDDMDQIREELTVLPEDLGAAYARVLARINDLRPPLKDKVRRILGWIACAPMPLELPEIEQALVVSRAGVDGDCKVMAGLHLPRICGPIVEVVDEYVQFVHFTVKEYLFSPRIDGHINLADATLSLATCCVTYLCQRHHHPDLTNENIAENIKSGSYRLHNFAAATWIQLVQRYIDLGQHEEPADDLIIVLEVLMERRSEIHGDDPEVAQPSLMNFKSKSPPLYNMLCSAAKFSQLCSKRDFDMNIGSDWVHLDPLTLSALSVRIHNQFKLFPCRHGKHENCYCEPMRRHYGLRSFKCGFLNCPFHRRGFESLSDQRTHMKHHDRPWKCSDPDCEFAEGGFLSRNMRDAHLMRYHTQAKSQALPDFVIAEADELQPLLFDLVKADNVDTVKSLMSQIGTLPGGVREALSELAASCGSCAMIDLLAPFHEKDFPSNLIRCSIRAMNMEVFSHLMSRSKDWSHYSEHGGRGYILVLPEVLKSDSEEIYHEWERHADLEDFHGNKKLYYWGFLGNNLIAATSRNPDREDLLLAFWEKIDAHKLWSMRKFGSGLINVLKTTCSVRLAKYFLDHGVDVDFRSSETNPTALQHAARNTTVAGAEMMKFLLLQGADPEARLSEFGVGRSYARVKRSGPRLSIREEKGARQISQWLGISWEELVAQTRSARAEGKSLS